MEREVSGSIREGKYCMNNYKIIKIREYPVLQQRAADWFHRKWKIPLEAYMESIGECLKNKSAIPQWYVAVQEGEIIGGLGVIENDFHDRKDLSPNVCALYVEEMHRRQGIAGCLLREVCQDMKEYGIDTLYLITDHTSFYERYGWDFLCMVQGDGEEAETRMYIHRSREDVRAVAE